MNLYYCQANDAAGTNIDLMVVAGDAQTAHNIWYEIIGFDNETTRCTANLVGVHLARPEQGYIEWGTFKHIPVDLL